MMSGVNAVDEVVAFSFSFSWFIDFWSGLACLTWCVLVVFCRAPCFAAPCLSLAWSRLQWSYYLLLIRRRTNGSKWIFGWSFFLLIARWTTSLKVGEKANVEGHLRSLLAAASYFHRRFLSLIICRFAFLLSRSHFGSCWRLHLAVYFDLVFNSCSQIDHDSSANFVFLSSLSHKTFVWNFARIQLLSCHTFGPGFKMEDRVSVQISFWGSLANRPITIVVSELELLLATQRTILLGDLNIYNYNGERKGSFSLASAFVSVFAPASSVSDSVSDPMLPFGVTATGSREILVQWAVGLLLRLLPVELIALLSQFQRNGEHHLVLQRGTASYLRLGSA